jgi:hypothetical protein
VRAVFLACLVAVAAAAPAAHAYVAPGATIVSASLERLEQADDATLSVGRNGYRIAQRLAGEPFDDQTRAYCGSAWPTGRPRSA